MRCLETYICAWFGIELIIMDLEGDELVEGLKAKTRFDICPQIPMQGNYKDTCFVKPHSWR